MKIGVLADTHSFEVPAQVLEALKVVDLIVHAGDFCQKEDVAVLTEINTVKAVFGNRDESAVKKMFPEKLIFEAGPWRIGLYHGSGCGEQVFECVRKVFAKDKVDAVIFGHSHQPMNKRVDGVLYFNPGSPNDCISAPYCSYGILDANDRKLLGKIIKIKG